MSATSKDATEATEAAPTAAPHRVNFMVNHPNGKGEILFAGDVDTFEYAHISPGQKGDNVFTELPQGTAANRVPREDRSMILGSNVNADAFSALQALAGLAQSGPLQQPSR